MTATRAKEVTVPVSAQLPAATFRAVTIEFTTGRRTLPPFQTTDLADRFLAFARIRDTQATGSSS